MQDDKVVIQNNKLVYSEQQEKGRIKKKMGRRNFEFQK